MDPFRKVKYNGLNNQGATCYLNSVLQVLFMTKDFRDAVKRHTSKNPDTQFIDHHLTALFDDLQKGRAYTYKITRMLGIHGVYEQRDAAEYFEKILSLTSPDASQDFTGHQNINIHTLSLGYYGEGRWGESAQITIFHGQLTHKTICSSCGTEKDSHGAFWHLPVALVDPNSESYSVENGIKEYFKDADCSGENQMYCDRCDDKCDATLKCLVKHHPEVLMLLLKRFEFNHSCMTHVKNNCTVEVPYTLKTPQNQTYELYAVVDHYGDLRSGFHTATIKSQDDGTWYTFNDTTVTLPDYQPFKVDQCERSFSAFLLFYRKINVHAEHTQEQNNKQMSSPGVFLSAASYHNEPCQGFVKTRWSVSDMSYLNKHDEMNEEQRRVMDVKTDKVEMTRDDEESEKKETPVIKHSFKDLLSQDKVEIGDVGLNTRVNLRGPCEVEQHYGLRVFSPDKQGELKRVEEVDKKGKTEADKRGKVSDGRKFLTISDLYGGGVSKKEERKGAQQVSNDFAASVSINENVETEIKDRDHATKVGLQPNTHSNVESQQNILSNIQEKDEERTDSSYNPQDAHAEITMTDTDMRGKAEADDEADKRENLSKENPLEERVEDQKNDSERQKTPDTHFDFKLAVSDRHVIQDHPNKQDEMNEEQRRVIEVKTEKVETTRDDEESEKKEKSGIKYSYSDLVYQDKVGSGDTRLLTRANLAVSWQVGRRNALKPFSVDRHGDWKRMEKVEKEEKTRAEDRGKEIGRRKLFTKYDLI